MKMGLEDMIKGAYPEIYLKYVMYTIGKSDSVCVEEFLVLGDLFKDVNWSRITPHEIEQKFNKVEESLK